MNSRDKPKTKTSSRQTKPQSSQRPTQSTSPRVSASARTSASRDGAGGSGRANRNNRKPIELNQRHGIKKAPSQTVRNEGETNKDNSKIDGNELASTSLLRNDDEDSNLIEQETNVDMSSELGRRKEARNQDLDDDDDDDDESSTLLESFSTPLKEPTTKLKGAKRHEDFLPAGWEQLSDQLGPYFWHAPTGLIQRTRPTIESLPKSDSVVLFHDDEEINQPAQVSRKISSDDDELDSCGAALTIADDTTLNDPAITFIVYPVGCCEFDETQLISSGTTKAIQRCILKLSNKPTKEEAQCWGLDQSQPVLMRLIDNFIQFTDIKTQLLIRSQPIPTLKTWAVDDDNNFAFVVEDCPQQSGQAVQYRDGSNSVDETLLNEPTFMCYVFRSMDDDDMSCKVAAKVNEEMNRYREQMSHRVNESARLQQMKEQHQATGSTTNDYDQATDVEEDLEDLEESNETTINVRYIGKVQVPKPTGVDTLNAAIDKCLTDASIAQLNRLKQTNGSSESDSQSIEESPSGTGGRASFVPLLDCKIHVSPSSVIVENTKTGEIIVECRIRYLTFIGISRRDIRWCGFIMQNTTNKSFVAHCFECNQSSEHVCGAIRSSCMRLYEKVVKNQQKQADATSIIPRGSLIRDTLAKTLSRIKLSPSI